MIVDYNDECTITEAGPLGLHNLLTQVVEKMEEGYVLDPKMRNSHIAKMISPFQYQVILVKPESKLKGELAEKTQEELLEIINASAKKDRLLELAKLMGVDLEGIESLVPTKIQKILRDSVKENS